MRELKAEGFRIVKQEDGSTLMLHPNAHRGADIRAYSDRGLLSDEERQELAENYVHNYAQDLREGDFHGTQVILDNITKSLAPPLVDELLKADIHLSFLQFLNQSDRYVSDVLGRVMDAGESIKLPYYWVGILGMLAQDGFSVDAREEARLTVAKGIGPFVASVIDGGRELFRSNHVWHLCVSPFFELVREVMKSRDGFVVMISYEGLLPFVAQASYWSQSRPDIVEECRLLRRRRRDPMSIPGTTLEVCEKAQQLIALLIWEHEDELDAAERKGALDQIACTPLVTDCADECNDSTIVGLVRMMSETEELDKAYLRDCVVAPLLLTHEYVDARVISELIEFGRSNSSLEDAETTSGMMVSLLGQDDDYDHVRLVDSRYAAAVRYGLVEFCIDALIAHRCASGCQIAVDLCAFAGGLCSTAMHSETSRALRERKEGIMVALATLRKKCAFDKECALINDAVEASAPATCCNCLKEVDRKDLLYCKRCGVECYCSADCQSESYELGHDELCKKEVDFVDWLRDEGLRETELKRLAVLNRNLMMNGCRLVRTMAAELLDEEEGNIAEVAIDFGDSPPDVEVSRGDDCEGSGSLKCTFTAPVYYGFADRMEMEDNVDLGTLVTEKFISRRSLAQYGPFASTTGQQG